MGRHIYEQLGTGFNCELDSSAPGGYSCVPNQFGAGDYVDIPDCIDASNGCKKWECIQAKKKKIGKISIREANMVSGCVAVNDSTALYSNPTDCNNSCSPDESWDCDGNGNCSDPGTGNGQYTSLINCEDACYTGEWWCEGNTTCKKNPQHWMSPTYQTKQACETNCGGQEVCCTVWVCVDGGPKSKCCKSLELCKIPGQPSNYSSFPWNLVESTNVPIKEFKSILKEVLLLEWQCSMDWSAHFGIWLGSTKASCQSGPSYNGVGPASGSGGCGPCLIKPHIVKDKLTFKNEKDGEIKSRLNIKEATNLFNKWKKEGVVKPLDDGFYKGMTNLVEEIYRTRNLLKG